MIFPLNGDIFFNSAHLKPVLQCVSWWPWWRPKPKHVRKVKLLSIPRSVTGVSWRLLFFFFKASEHLRSWRSFARNIYSTMNFLETLWLACWPDDPSLEWRHSLPCKQFQRVRVLWHMWWEVVDSVLTQSRSLWKVERESEGSEPTRGQRNKWRWNSETDPCAAVWLVGYHLSLIAAPPILCPSVPLPLTFFFRSFFIISDCYLTAERNAAVKESSASLGVSVFGQNHGLGSALLFSNSEDSTHIRTMAVELP